MALIALLRGANVGRYRRFRPAELAKEMAELSVVNIGAAGTLVVKKPIGAAAFRAELVKRLAFETDIMICSAAEILALAESKPFQRPHSGSDARAMVTVLAKKPKTLPELPIRRPEGKDWQVDLFRVAGRFALAFWRGDRTRLIYPNEVAEKVLGIPGTTRTSSTIEAACAILAAP